MSKSTRPFTLLARPIIRRRPFTRARYSILHRSGQVNVQPVSFVRPPLGYGRVLRFATKFLVTASFFWIVSGYLADTLEDEEDQPGAETTTTSIAANAQAPPDGLEGEGVAEGEDGEKLLVELPDEMPEDAIHLPLWFRKRQVPATPYKESDPEWQGYVKFSRDKRKKQVVEIKCVRLLYELLSKTTNIGEILGSPIKATGWSFDYDYPLSPPRDIDKTGIEIADEYVALSSRPISPEQYMRIKRVIWPESVAKACFVSMKTYGRLLRAKLRGYLVVPNNAQEEKMSQEIPGAPNFLKRPVRVAEGTAVKKQEKQIDAELGKLSNPKEVDNHTAKQNTSAPLDATRSSVAKPPEDKKTFSISSIDFLSLLPKIQKSDGDFGAAVAAFKQMLAMKWGSGASLQRGSILVFGMVELSGSRRKTKIDFTATYHPGTNEVEMIQIRSKPTIAHRLVPRG